MDRMTTSQLPAPVTLLPVGDDKNLLTVCGVGRVVLRRFRLRHRQLTLRLTCGPRPSQPDRSATLQEDVPR